MAEQTNEENIVFLPWTVESQPQTQALTLENPQQQKIYVDLAHSTDWVVAASIIVSGLISFFGFVITFFLVKKSTENQIKSNRDLYQSQEKLKLMEIEAKHTQNWIIEVRDIFTRLLANIDNLSAVIKGYIKSENFDFNSSDTKYRMYKEIFSFRKDRYELKLRLNHSKKETKEIFETLDQVERIFIDVYGNFNKMRPSFNEDWDKIEYRKMCDPMKELLKQEWERVKKGE
jgi:uncharacterized protein YneF (UPF0154 family)